MISVNNTYSLTIFSRAWIFQLIAWDLHFSIVFSLSFIILFTKIRIVVFPLCEFHNWPSFSFSRWRSLHWALISQVCVRLRYPSAWAGVKALIKRDRVYIFLKDWCLRPRFWPKEMKNENVYLHWSFVVFLKWLSGRTGFPWLRMRSLCSY